MSKLSTIQVDQIVESCLDLYNNKLSKTGKPVKNEWTVLSCIVQYDSSRCEHRVVSLGTGSKCLGAGLMSPRGDLLNDSHAEVIARRGFLLYLYENIQAAIDNRLSVFQAENRKFKLKENIEFIFYSSQLPCGDASILPKCSDEEQFGDVLTSLKRQGQAVGVGDGCDSERKRIRTEVDINRTGAKCLPDSEQDPKMPGINYHLLGQVRTKPGRGDRTLSVSCSDKIARWIHVGIQGALLDMLCGPVHIKHFIFGGGVPYSEKSLRRAFLDRAEDSTHVLKSVPHLYQSGVSFPQLRSGERVRPAPGSILWTSAHQTSEVSVQGRKLGLTKKKAVSPKNAVCISKYKLYERFHGILSNNEKIKQDIFGDTSIEDMAYNEMKRRSTRYLENWAEVKEKFFRRWTVKPDMWDFRLEQV